MQLQPPACLLPMPAHVPFPLIARPTRDPDSVAAPHSAAEGLVTRGATGWEPTPEGEHLKPPQEEQEGTVPKRLPKSAKVERQTD